MLKLAIIIGSTRPGRVGEAVARWVLDLAQKRGSKDIFVNILTDTGLVQRFVTDWAGPRAVLTSIKLRLGVPWYAYDTLTLSGTVTSYEENTADTGGGLSFRGISLGGKKSEAYIAIDVRVVNSETGEVDYSRTIEGRSSGGGVSVGLYRGGFGGNLAHEENTPAGKAIRAALVEITDYPGCVMVTRGSCEAEFSAKERKRRDSNRKALKLD